MKINQHHIGQGKPVYIIAEMSANHNQQLDEALKIIDAAKDAGADAVKLQTYTADTLTLDCDNDFFRIKDTIWNNENLFSLYSRAATPWEWHKKLKTYANEKGMDLFSTPFDDSAVDFLEELNVPAYKVASFELVDLPLLKTIAGTGKPVIMSTGMASLAEIQEAVDTLRSSGCRDIALLKCTSAYPADPGEMNLKTIPHLSQTFNVPAGLSDHTLGIEVPVAAAALGASIIEKHLTLSRNNPGPDALFSLTPREFKHMVQAVRNARNAIGNVSYGITDKQKSSRAFRRSLFVIRDMNKGDLFSSKNIRSIRPGFGLHTRYLDTIIGRRATVPIERGTPLSWEHVG